MLDTIYSFYVLFNNVVSRLRSSQHSRLNNGGAGGQRPPPPPSLDKLPQVSTSNNIQFAEC